MATRQPEAPHPFKQWMESKGLTFEDVAELCKARGWPTTPDYIGNIANKYQRPGWDFAAFLSEEITTGAIDERVFRLYGKGKKSKRAKKRAA